MFDGQHHVHKRKRIHQKHEPYPHPEKWKRLMDRLIYIVGILGPVMSVPQLLDIWIGRSTAGVSLVTWGAFLLMSFFWLAYGIMHRDKPIILTYICWIAVESMIVFGIIIYS